MSNIMLKLLHLDHNINKYNLGVTLFQIPQMLQRQQNLKESSICEEDYSMLSIDSICSYDCYFFNDCCKVGR